MTNKDRICLPATSKQKVRQHKRLTCKTDLVVLAVCNERLSQCLRTILRNKSSQVNTHVRLPVKLVEIAHRAS